MNKLEAKNLIVNTFEKPFDETQFTYFIKNLLNNLDESKRKEYRGQFVPESFSDAVKHYKRIGQYIDSKNNVIDVLIVNLNRGTSLERARSLQRNFIARYLKQRTHDASLVAYYTDGSNDWRFSLVKMDINLNNKKIETDFTPARRYSFLVGTNEGSHTAQNQFVKLLTEKVENPTLDSIEDSFNIETVTKEFFLKYRDLFIRIKQSLDKVIINDSILEAEFKSKKINSVDFSKKLLGQIVFLYFLQKKGWFGVEKNSKWGSGSRKFLRELFKKKHGAYNNFFNDILEPLFYEALRNDRTHDDHYYSRFNCKIPFLNGGLFDPIGNYDWSKTDIILPNELFSNTQQTKDGDIGDGILDVFDRYNFTVIEDEPLEKEVAIDPELLGKAYEKFNAIRPDNFDEYLKVLKSGKKGEESKFNKQYGVFYTPREIVHYMCQQSLINYLVTELDGKVNKEAIVFLILEGEKFVEHLRTAKEKNENIEDYTGKYKENGHFLELKVSANEIDNLLANLKMCDPAVGSGAFPVGMMSEIVKARMFFVITNCLDDKYINPHNQKVKSNPYSFKRDCIENSLYGVDIDSGAVEIAKLRLWLSLVVDEDDITNIKPLPNLDYKIICGNSLLGYPYKPIGLDPIEALKNAYIFETNPTKKYVLRKQIDEAFQSLYKNTQQSLGYNVTMDFRINFSEVFHQNGGFHIVIGNPPYVSADNSEIAILRSQIMQSNQYTTLYERWDLMLPFYEKSLRILNSSGVHVFIASNSITTSKFTYRFQDWVIENYKVNSVDYFEDDMQIFEAGVVPVVTIIQKTEQKVIPKKIYRSIKFANIVRIVEVDTKQLTNLRERIFKKSFSVLFYPNIKTDLLGDICYISYGLRPNSDERFWKGEFKATDIISDNYSTVFCKKYVEGKFISKYCIHKIKYLEWNTKRVPAKLVRPTFPDLYNGNKLFLGVLTGGAFDNTGIVCNHSIVVVKRFIDLKGIKERSISVSISKNNLDGKGSKTSFQVAKRRKELQELSEIYLLKYLLAVINSKYAMAYLNNFRKHRLENYFYPDDFRNFPIPQLPLQKQQTFVTIVDKILTAKKQDPQANTKQLEDQIDIIVYKLYNLTYEEVKTIDPDIEKIISEKDYEKL